jgi:hypothetical protein
LIGTLESQVCTNRGPGEGPLRAVPGREAGGHQLQEAWLLLFGIEIESCARCGARLKIVASIEDLGVIARILAQGDHASDRSQEPRVLHAARAPPGQWAV